MSLATLHTDAHKRLATVRGYPARLAMRAAIGIAVRLFKADPATVDAMQTWHANAKDSAETLPALNEVGSTPAFALIGVATRKPLLLVGALAAFAAFPVLLLFKFI